MKASTLYYAVQVLDSFAKNGAEGKATDPLAMLRDAFVPICELIDEFAPQGKPADQLEVEDFIEAIGEACAAAIPAIVSLSHTGEALGRMNAKINQAVSSISSINAVPESPAPQKRERIRTKPRGR